VCLVNTAQSHRTIHVGTSVADTVTSDGAVEVAGFQSRGHGIRVADRASANAERQEECEDGRSELHLGGSR